MVRQSQQNLTDDKNKGKNPDYSERTVCVLCHGGPLLVCFGVLVLEL